MLHGIVNDIHQSLAKKHTIASYINAFVSLNDNPLSLLLHQDFKQSRSFTRQVHRREDRGVQLDTASVRTRNGQETLHQRREAIDFFQHAANNVPVFFRALRLLKADFAHASHCCQRRAQFMSHIRSEMLQFLKRLAKASQ